MCPDDHSRHTAASRTTTTEVHETHLLLTSMLDSNPGIFDSI
jgi:hypothetical protein